MSSEVGELVNSSRCLLGGGLPQTMGARPADDPRGRTSILKDGGTFTEHCGWSLAMKDLQSLRFRTEPSAQGSLWARTRGSRKEEPRAVLLNAMRQSWPAEACTRAANTSNAITNKKARR